jgi:hypothetical protein
MTSHNKIAVYAAMVIIVSFLLDSCGTPTPTLGVVGSTGPLTITATLSPDPTNYGACDNHITTIRVTATGPASTLASLVMGGILSWTNPDGSQPDMIVTGFSPMFTRQADGSFLYTYDWSYGVGVTTPLTLLFEGIAYDSAETELTRAPIVSVALNPCPGIAVIAPQIPLAVTLVAPSPHLTVNATLSPDPVYYEGSCDPHVSNVRVTLSGTLASLVSTFDSSLSWTLPDGTPPASANGVPVALALQPDGSYTGSYDWGVHPPGLTGPYFLNFMVIPVDSSGLAFDKQVVVTQFLPCPGPAFPMLPPFHLVKFEFDCLSLNSTVMIFTFDQALTGSFQGQIGNQNWPCQVDAKNTKILICSGPGVDQNVKAQVSLMDLLRSQTVLTKDTTTPTCQLPTACPLTDGYCQTKYTKDYHACPTTCTCAITCP